jgi:DNA-binding response OmpR family regulator
MLISARRHEADAVLALNNGADHYLAKPIGRALACARIRALLRRAVEHRNVVRVGYCRIDSASRRVMMHIREVLLTDKEVQMADLLLSNQHTLLSRDY